MKISVPLSVFGKKLLVFIDSNEKAVKYISLNAVLEKERDLAIGEVKHPETEASFQTFRCKDDTREYLMTFKKLKKCPESYNILYHEINHFVAQLFKDLGIPYTLENDETSSYVGGYVMEEITKKMWL